MLLYFDPMEVYRMCNIAIRATSCHADDPEEGPIILIGLDRDGTIMHPRMPKGKQRERATVYPIRALALDKTWQASRKPADKRKWTWEVPTSRLKRAAAQSMDLLGEKGCVRVQDQGYELVIDIATTDEAKYLSI